MYRGYLDMMDSKMNFHKVGFKFLVIEKLSIF